ncbi:MAG TPA: type II toxin-antitoxin system VapC family toxin, partial [Pyrinomonadaceae bacterium]
TNENFLSVASLWEMAIKVSLGKLTLSAPLDVLTPQRHGVELLSIQAAHAIAVSAMTFHHRDPFDRLLVAQAIIEGMQIISADAAFDAYPVKRLW